ncbi:hypothetical protein Pmani_031909 [Petrolisthes manimaculis]|uniref:Solute carrier family 35 member F1 n=1 Tax=Petrolisthes manimaculis TaxID=1843537 RepID=A0AAE1TUB2_9EUCA|nr:hypothetical protein Pmani_031909 [Petrolisthes manimaculis]
MLCLVYTTWLACRSGEGSLLRVVRTKGLKYFVLAAVDVEANYLVLRAYQFTSVTSVQLLDCFVVPVVLALSWLFLKVRYKLVHVLGVGLCLLGVGCLVWANVEDGKAAIPGYDRLLGDMLCLGGATLYGISNVAQEYVVKTYDSVEFLGMMGLFGSLINGIQLAVLERNDVGSVRWDTWPVLALVGGFSAAQFLFYVVAPAVIRATSATALNLALFTTDFYILITGIALFKFKVFHPLYFLSYLLVVTGVIVFVIKPTPITSTSRGYYREVSLGRFSGGNEVELTTTPGTATSSMGGGASFNDWPLPPEVRGCPDYPFPHSHPAEYRQGSAPAAPPVATDYPSTPPSPPQQFRSLPRPARREPYPSSGGGAGQGGGQRAATLHRPARSTSSTTPLRKAATQTFETTQPRTSAHQTSATSSTTPLRKAVTQTFETTQPRTSAHQTSATVSHQRSSSHSSAPLSHSTTPHTSTTTKTPPSTIPTTTVTSHRTNTPHTTSSAASQRSSTRTSTSTSHPPASSTTVSKKHSVSTPHKTSVQSSTTSTRKRNSAQGSAATTQRKDDHGSATQPERSSTRVGASVSTTTTTNTTNTTTTSTAHKSSKHTTRSRSHRTDTDTGILPQPESENVSCTCGVGIKPTGKPQRH